MSDDVTTRMIEETGGDPARGRQVRRALTRLLESPDPELRQLARDTLDGRRPVRSVLASPAFDRALQARMTQFWEQYTALDDDQRAELLGRGAEQRARDLEGDD